MQPLSPESGSDEGETLLGPAPARKRRVVAGALAAALGAAALFACGLHLARGPRRSDGTAFLGLNSEDTADADTYKEMIHKKIAGFAHICEDCRGDAKEYYGGKLDEVTALAKKCEADEAACDDAKKEMKEVMDAVNGAWDGTKCPAEMPMSCTITSECDPFPKKACAPKTCHPINLLKSFGVNNNCAKASMECDGEDKVSLSDKVIAEEYKAMIHKKIEGFAHICEDCRGDAKKYYGGKLDEVTALEKKCEADEAACDGAREEMKGVMDAVNGAWAGTKCPDEMPMSCTIKSECKPFPTNACAPKTCHPINLLKSFGKNNDCTDATMACDGEEEVSLKEA